MTSQNPNSNCLCSVLSLLLLAGLFNTASAETRKPQSVARRAAAPSLAVKVDSAIHKLEIPAKPEYLDPREEAQVAKPAATAEVEVTEDGREAPPQREHISWKLDYPMPGELKLGRWRAAETKALGLAAVFPIPKVQ